MSAARLEVLSRDEVERIHGATLELLEEVGVLVREARAQRLLLDAGARREGAERFFLPPSLVTSAVAAVPKRWTWHAREPEDNLVIGEGGRTRLGPGSACTKIIDFETGSRRAPTAADGDALVRLMDALEFVDINYTPVSLSGSEGTTSYDECATLVRDIENTSKVHVGPSYNGAMARDGLKIEAVMAGGDEELRRRPSLAGYCDPVGPLIHDRAMTEVIVEYAALGQPVFLMCLDFAGGSAPPTLAGTLLQQNAEILSGVVIAHLVNPAAPVIYGCVSGALDMRTGDSVLGGPEFGLLSAASVQMARFYGLPCSAGGQSDASTHDAQASLEKGQSLLASVLAGADFVDLFFGSYEGFNTTSFEQVILDHDIAGYVFRYARGIEVTEETLALDLIREVGPGGSFLRNRRALELTLHRMKREYYLPSVLRRAPGERGGPGPSPTLLQEAHDRAARILREHRPPPLDADVLRSLREALGEIRRTSAAPAAR